MKRDDDKKKGPPGASSMPIWVIVAACFGIVFFVARSMARRSAFDFQRGGGGAAPVVHEPQSPSRLDELAAELAALKASAPAEAVQSEAVQSAWVQEPVPAVIAAPAAPVSEKLVSTAPVSEKPKKAGKQPKVPDADAARAGAGALRSQLQPLWGLEAIPSNDVVMALGFGYSRQEFARFISTLRGTGYDGDIALAAGPEAKMQRGVAEYLKGERVLSYPFEYSCVKKSRGRRLQMTPSGCVLTNWYAAGEQRGPRPLALARYEMYRSWLLNYNAQSWGIIFDFRDTFFQLDPFAMVDRSPKKPNLHLFAENRKVKRVGNCVFNAGWLRCWGKEVPKAYANNSVVCSGSTMGTVDALLAYSSRMVAEFDKMQCHATPARTESDQGYHNYLYDTGALAALKGVRVVHHEQGEGLVNTIGAMNGYRVPKSMKGPLDTHWKIRDAEGYMLEYDGSRSAVVHQWDRFYHELKKFVDKLVRDYERNK